MSEAVEKLSFSSSDFKFNIAYQAYENKFNDVEESDKERLNEAVQGLFDDSVSYEDFYKVINQEEDRRYEFHRTKISGSRKFSYRKEQQKVDRIKRHK